MKTKSETEVLNELIMRVQKKRENEFELLKNNLHDVCESLRPLNLIKSVFTEVANSDEIKNNLTNNVVGLGTGFLLKKILLGSSDNFSQKILGLVIQFGVAKVVSKNFDDIKLITGHFLKQFLISDKAKIG